MTKWEWACARVTNVEKINAYLTEGWEPFAVESDSEVRFATLHFRRQVSEVSLAGPDLEIR